MAVQDQADFLIVGGGVIGLSIARELRRLGAKRVVVIDRGTAGMEASWAAAGMLAPNAECDVFDDFYGLCRDSLAMWPSFADELRDETGIDVELDRTGTLELAFTDEDVRRAEAKFGRQLAAGVSVERLAPGDVLRVEPLVSPAVKLGFRYPDDWQVENRKLVDALRRSAALRGIEVGEGVAVESLRVAKGRVTAAVTSAGELSASNFIIAAGCWTSLINIDGARGPRLPTVRPIKGQMIACEMGRADFRHVIYSHKGYLVPRRDGRVLVGATVEDAGFDKQTTAEGIASLERAAAEISGRFAGARPAETWAGLRPFAAGGRPVIGVWPEIPNLAVATGHYRNGILLTPLTAGLIANKLLNDVGSPFLEAFGPGGVGDPSSSAAAIT